MGTRNHRDCRGHRHPRLQRPITRAQAEQELWDLYHRAGFRGRPAVSWTEELRRTHLANSRRYAQVQIGGGVRPHFELAPQSVYLPRENRRALFAHEVGHVAAGPDGSEDAADAAAFLRTGVRVGYDHRWPGKGLQVARNSGERWRALEHAWLSSGDPGDLAAYLSARARAQGSTGDRWLLENLQGGALPDPARLWILARMNEPGARDGAQLLLGPIPIAPHGWQHGSHDWEYGGDWTRAFYWLLVEDIQREAGDGEQIPPHRVVTRLLAFAALAKALDRKWEDAAWTEHAWADVTLIPSLVADSAVDVARQVTEGEVSPEFAVQLLAQISDRFSGSLNDSQYWFDAYGVYSETILVPEKEVADCRRIVGYTEEEESYEDEWRGDMARCLSEWAMDQGSDVWSFQVEEVQVSDDFTEAEGNPGLHYAGMALFHYLRRNLVHWALGARAFQANPRRRRRNPAEEWPDVVRVSLSSSLWAREDPRPWVVYVRKGGYQRRRPEVIGRYASPDLADEVARYEAGRRGIAAETHSARPRDNPGGRLRRNPGGPGQWKTPPPCDTSGSKKLKYGVKLSTLKGKKVRVHVNLHNGCYVVSHKGRVAGYAKSLKLKGAVPRVSVAGWKACNSTKVRNVHAYIEGTLVSASAKKPAGAGWKKITYACKSHGPCFYYPSNDKTFEGAAEVVFRNLGGEGFKQIEVLAKGRPAKKNPAPCGCRHPGGACECGKVQSWWREKPPGCGC